MKLSGKEFDAMQMGWRKWYIEKTELRTFRKFGFVIKGADIWEMGCGIWPARALWRAAKATSAGFPTKASTPCADWKGA